MDRPFSDYRKFGPFFDGSYLQEQGVLRARKQCNPEIRLEIAELDPGIDKDVFEVVETNAKFDVDDIIVGKEEGQIGTNEPAITTIQIISSQQEIDLIDINQLVDVLKSKYTVFESTIGASVDIDPSNINDPFEDTEFIDKPTDI